MFVNIFNYLMFHNVSQTNFLVNLFLLIEIFAE